jgi:hypothetical protein
MSRVVCRQINRVDSWLFLVASQIGNLTPDPSFGHNLCFKCSNEQCKPILDIYVSRAFQRYKEHHKSLRFDPLNCFLKFQKSIGTPSPKMGVALGVWMFTPSHCLTLSYTPGSMWCDSPASSWPAPLQCLCLDSRASFLLDRNLATPLPWSRAQSWGCDIYLKNATWLNWWLGPFPCEHPPYLIHFLVVSQYCFFTWIFLFI